MIEQVHAHDWQAWIDEHDGVIVDVREPKEWAGGTLPGSHLISLDTLPQHLEDLPQDSPMLIICRSGNRSQVAAMYLARNGYGGAANLKGGLEALGLA